MIYDTIALIAAGFFLVLSMLPVFHPGVRRKFISTLGPYDILYEFLTVIEDGVDGSGDEILVVLGFILYAIIMGLVSSLLGMLWPASFLILMLALPLRFILNANAKKKKNG